MTERLTLISRELLRPHPDNVRIDATADDAMVESIGTHGLIDPLLVAPDPEADGQYLVLDGNRRLDGCDKAGVGDVSCRVREDLVTLAQQIEVMAITGLQKEHLSPVEEAAAYEQLTLLGMDASAIAASTGFSVKRVKGRMRLNGLSDQTRGAVHAGDATLADVEALLEFADDAAATKDLEATLGTADFASKVHMWRGRRDRVQRNEAAMAELREAGAVRVESVPGEPGKVREVSDGGVLGDRTFDQVRVMYAMHGDLADPAKHDGCLGFSYDPEFFYADIRTYCLDVSRHPELNNGPAHDPVADAKQRQEWESQQAARAAEQEQQKAASAARAAWLVEHFTSLFPTKGNAQLAATLTGFLPAALADPRLDDLVTDRSAEIVGADPATDRTWEAKRTAVQTSALDLTTAKPAQALGALARFLALWCAELLDQSYVDDDELPTLVWLWDWLAESGYPMSTVDTARHQELAQRAGQHDDEGGDG